MFFDSKERLMSTPLERSRNQLVDDFAAVLSEAEDLLEKASAETGDRAKVLRDQVQAKLLAAKHRLQDMQDDAIDRAKDAARYADDYVRDNPWQAVGLAAAVGFIAGLVITRR
jgi:ElaB/YqjD/DUF883 family membrane-anchored ribosome-binding protein